MRFSAILVFALLISGCGSEHVTRTVSADDLLHQLAALDLDPQNYASYQAYDREITGQISRSLKTLAKPSDLRETFWLCHSKSRSMPLTPQDRLQWINPYDEALNLILYELADRKDPACAAILVDLYLDPAVGWDAGASLMAGDAVVKCGKPALPFLRERQGEKPGVGRLIQLIEDGATTGL